MAESLSLRPRQRRVNNYAEPYPRPIPNSQLTALFAPLVNKFIYPDVSSQHDAAAACFAYTAFSTADALPVIIEALQFARAQTALYGTREIWLRAKEAEGIQRRVVETENRVHSLMGELQVRAREAQDLEGKLLSKTRACEDLERRLGNSSRLYLEATGRAMPALGLQQHQQQQLQLQRQQHPPQASQRGGSAGGGMGAEGLFAAAPLSRGHSPTASSAFAGGGSGALLLGRPNSGGQQRAQQAQQAQHAQQAQQAQQAQHAQHAQHAQQRGLIPPPTPGSSFVAMKEGPPLHLVVNRPATSDSAAGPTSFVKRLGNR